MPQSAWRRRYKARKAQLKRRRVARGRVGKIRQPVHYFKRSVFTPAAFTVSAGTDFFNASQFQLGFLPDVTDFTSLYDQYKILSVTIKLMPRGNSSDVGVAAGIGNMTRVFSVLDYDDSVVPTSLNQLIQYQNLKTTNSTSIHTRTLKPMFIKEVQTITGTGGSPTRGGWIDVLNTNVQYRGVKWCIQAPSNGSVVYDQMVTYNLAMKNVR